MIKCIMQFSIGKQFMECLNIWQSKNLLHCSKFDHKNMFAGKVKDRTDKSTQDWSFAKDLFFYLVEFKVQLFQVIAHNILHLSIQIGLFREIVVKFMEDLFKNELKLQFMKNAEVDKDGKVQIAINLIMVESLLLQVSNWFVRSMESRRVNE
jgi:hypothetical protein